MHRNVILLFIAFDIVVVIVLFVLFKLGIIGNSSKQGVLPTQHAAQNSGSQ